MRIIYLRHWIYVLLLTAVGAVHAQSYPSKPVRIIAPFTAGSTIDIMSRVIAAKLLEPLGQQVLVENRAGAGGAVGIEAAARSAKDGYTIMLSAAGLTIIPSLNPRLSWDPVRDFSSITQVATSTSVLVLNPAVPAKNLRELVVYAKAQPGRIRYGHAGIGSTQHMAGQLLSVVAGIDMVDVPYRGNEEALSDLLGGRLEMNFQGIPTVISQIRNGKARPIVVMGQKRSAVLVDVPTVGEEGLPGATISSWYGLLAPVGTPLENINRLNQAITVVMKSPDVIDHFAKGGADVVTGTPEEFSRLIRDEVAMWSRVIKQRGIKLE